MRQQTITVSLSLALVGIAAAQEPSGAGQLALDRLPPAVFEVEPPSARVRGVPGAMSVQPRTCRTLPIGDTRRRIVDIAVQEWGFFGFRMAAPTDGEEEDVRGRGRRSRLPASEASRVAASIAGYWAVTPEGAWIVERQNDRWNGPDGIAARWNAPWSAAFVSWVMCEAGLGATTQFHRAIAHHTYIDQAIHARDGRAPQAAFVAYDAGETTIAPGDLLCSSRRPAYRTLARAPSADRRRRTKSLRRRRQGGRGRSAHSRHRRQRARSRQPETDSRGSRLGQATATGQRQSRTSDVRTPEVARPFHRRERTGYEPDDRRTLAPRRHPYRSASTQAGRAARLLIFRKSGGAVVSLRRSVY